MKTPACTFILLAVIMVTSLTSCMQAAPTLEPGDSKRQVTVDGMERSYLLHIPPGVDIDHPSPLVFAFHGAGSDPQEMESSSEFSAISDEAGFILIYPVGLEQTWNAGSCCGWAVENNIDEAAFVRQILADVEGIAKVDQKRIYATGFSNGGGMVYRLACEMSDTFAAVAPVAGSLVIEPCQPSQPVSLIDVHGKKDIMAPYEGGGELNLRPMQEIIKTWAQLDGCPGTPKLASDKKLTHTAYATCKKGTAVEHYAIEQGGHSWPSKYFWNASQVIWDFFAAHPKP